MEKYHFIQKKLGHLFETEEGAVMFAKRYWNELKDSARTSDIDFYGWEVVAEEILNEAGKYYDLEKDDYLSLEIGSLNTKTGNPEMVLIGVVLSVPYFEKGSDDLIGEYKFYY